MRRLIRSCFFVVIALGLAGCGESAPDPALAIVGVGVALFFLPIAIALVVVLRAHELFNPPDNARPVDAHINTLELDEDHGVHNQLAAVGLLQLVVPMDSKL